MEASPPPGPPGPGGEQELSPEQLEMLRQMEEEMRRVRVQDVVTQSAVSILNLAARRIAKEDERDLEQARIGIEAVRALVDLLEPEPQAEVRNALSQLQVMFAQESGGGQGGGESPAEGEQGAGPSAPQQPRSPGLWTPGSD
jgi:hypothetical protein